MRGFFSLDVQLTTLLSTLKETKNPSPELWYVNWYEEALSPVHDQREIPERKRGG